MATNTEINRMMLEIDQAIKDINREVINPEIRELAMGDLVPVFNLVAKTRAAYLKELFDIAKMSDEMPSKDQIERLGILRHSYDEMLASTKALLTAIERGYLDVVDCD